MSTVRYKKLITNLPSMAAIVNSFESPQVQLAVYDTLIAALNDATQESRTSDSASSRSADKVETVAADSSVEHELVEGDSIHSMAAEE